MKKFQPYSFEPPGDNPGVLVLKGFVGGADLAFGLDGNFLSVPYGFSVKVGLGALIDLKALPRTFALLL